MIPRLPDSRFAALLWSCGLLGFLAFGLAVPPFQIPDEPHHFAAAMIQARGEGEREAVERETIELMDRFGWWSLVGIGRPAEPPSRISDIKFLMADSRSRDFRDRIQGFVLYHRIAGGWLSLVGARDPAAAYFALRILSIAFGAAGMAFLFLAFRTLSAAWDAELRFAPALAVFLPQLAFVGSGVSPDMFVFLLGAAFSRAAAGVIASRPGFGLVSVLLAAAALGAMADRSSLVFPVLLVLVPFLVIKKANAPRVAAGSLFGLVAGAGLLYALSLLSPASVENVAAAVKSASGSARKAFSELGGLSPFERRFWLQLVDTSFLRFGWMHFGPPRFFVWIWRLAWIAGAAGLVLGVRDFVRSRIRGGETDADSVRRRLILFCLAAFVLQSLGVWIFYGPAHILPQGRYLFPVLPAVLALMAAGMRRLGDAFGRGGGRRLVLAFAVFMIFAWVYAFWAIAVPVFRLTVRGPYPGI